MGGMKDEAKRITVPPLFPRVHVNDTVRGRGGGGGLPHPLYKKSATHLPSPTKYISSHSHSNLSLSLPPPPPPPPPNHPPATTDRSEKNQFLKDEGKMIKEGMSYPSPRGSLTPNEYHHFKNLTNSDSFKFPRVRRSETDPQANTDLSLQFCTSGSSKAGGGGRGGGGAKASMNSLLVQELVLSECLEDASQSKSFRSQLNRGRTTLAGSINDTQKKPETVPPWEQDSAVDSLSGLSASSNDVARVIGDKRFWRIRTYMINQQKIFTAQVFELHRLIMVQKMVAKSPKLFLRCKVNGVEHGPVRPSAHLLENHKPVTEEYPKNVTPKLALPPISKELVSPNWPQLPLPPGNQWLVPVMSPSEGLVYKPYAGPCPPPPSAFMVPLPQFTHSYFPTPLDHNNQFQRWSSTTSNVTQAIPVSLKKSQGSNESTASSPPEMQKLLPLFPEEPTHHTTSAIKAVPHSATSGSEAAERIFRRIQEERDHIIS